MTAHELMVKTNRHLIKSGELTEKQKANIIVQLLAARSAPEQAARFYRGVKFPNNIDSEGRRMYPIFFIPPYNDGMKLKTIYNQTPKTHIFSANMYELEIIRLLYLFMPDNPTIQDMVMHTLTLRNCLSRFPEYTHIKDIKPYVSEKDRRLHFNMNVEGTENA